MGLELKYCIIFYCGILIEYIIIVWIIYTSEYASIKIKLLWNFFLLKIILINM